MVVLEWVGWTPGCHHVVDPELCVITPIDFDHEAMLVEVWSDRRREGCILKSGVPAVFARQRPEAARVLEDRG